MRQKKRIPFSNLTFENWQNLIILPIIVVYLVWMGSAIKKGPIEVGFAGDYLAFWSAGKIADEKGYSEIYDLENLKSVQLKELNEFVSIGKIEASSYAPFPVALLSFFVLPFQVLSKIDFEWSYWIWTVINLIVLIGYLCYFTKKNFPGNPGKVPWKKILLIMLISYQVWHNFTEGQVNIFLVVCAGEFIRQAINKKPVLSGLWLGGLLLKPQLLILILPTLLIMRYWKAVSGFIFSSFILLMSSFFLSGFAGMKAMFNLWTRFSAGMATNAPERMINWRMIGVNINSLFGTSFGWVFTGLGMTLTLILVLILLKARPDFGSPTWIVTMAAVFSATLAVTWHSHDHMAVVLIPFLVFVSQFKFLPKRIIFFWVAITSIIQFPNFGNLVAISSFCLNITFFIYTYRYLHLVQFNPKKPFIENPAE